ncbi:conserved Plasmodium protein, unknown function [Plasmodium knowlesi strain H]|uniref:Uncharacterized protein n=3 Tax=Plasmodium knowlesi TaxID=5850 RepID=B3L8U7_PLAKH|nr:conserved protein, unknown function [Plasmodium knowlesi strain H]OTN66451.1 Uncharacterized protein PKNOH_S09526900 [Plasmodium knowlesi]CAA9990038.1 conserved protein, unknown function [Plasmodium knowlesi strain H]SBO24644.1 conserved Plasmodium protein, unknown function [Plasmodium knowlesi strain H]VVS79512.1 conserved protein, unknown function [Plasmodium knowlesi strain H]|eukprot:XP_002260053.1 hypothetical protein, conserved in Plasmodium species [Plasmodium knowlesi strain H]
MSVKSRMHMNQVNKTLFRENYKVERKCEEDIELMETIENFSDDIMLKNDSFESSAYIKSSTKNISDRGNEITIKGSNLKNLKKKNATGNNDHSGEGSVGTDGSNGGGSINKNNNGGNGNEQSCLANIPQIYETHDSTAKEELHSDHNNEEDGVMYILSNIMAVLYIIVAIVTILHLHLDEDHAIIKAISALKLKFVGLMKDIPAFKSLMITVALINVKINTLLEEGITKGNIFKPYVEALKPLNTEFTVLFTILILIFFTAISILCIIHGIINMKNDRILMEKGSSVFVANKMTMEEFEDKSFTYSELAKLHSDKDYICLKNKRAGEGIESWNWQMRKMKSGNHDRDICSDIELSDGEKH